MGSPWKTKQPHPLEPIQCCHRIFQRKNGKNLDSRVLPTTAKDVLAASQEHERARAAGPAQSQSSFRTLRTIALHVCWIAPNQIILQLQLLYVYVALQHSSGTFGSFSGTHKGVSCQPPPLWRKAFEMLAQVLLPAGTSATPVWIYGRGWRYSITASSWFLQYVQVLLNICSCFQIAW